MGRRFAPPLARQGGGSREAVYRVPGAETVRRGRRETDFQRGRGGPLHHRGYPGGSDHLNPLEQLAALAGVDAPCPAGVRECPDCGRTMIRGGDRSRGLTDYRGRGLCRRCYGIRLSEGRLLPPKLTTRVPSPSLGRCVTCAENLVSRSGKRAGYPGRQLGGRGMCNACYKRDRRQRQNKEK